MDCISHYIPNVLGIIGVLGFFVQISPVKVNPISWIGDMLMKNTNKKIVEMKCEITETRNTIDVNEIENLRRVILNFSCTCQNGVKHSQEQFTQLFKDNVKYHKLLEKHKLTNGRVDRDFKYIDELYHKCLEEHDFL